MKCQYAFIRIMNKYNMQKVKGVKKTTRINSTIDSEIESEFRETVYSSFGFKKGNLQRGLEEAIQAWIDFEKKKNRGK